MTTTTTRTIEDGERECASEALAAYLYANDFSFYELLENYPAIEIDDLPPSLRLARRMAATSGDGPHEGY